MPAASTKARAVSSRSAAETPSRVSTDLPSHFSAAVAQVTLAAPSMMARQQPHWPCGWQPSLSDLMPHRSRRASSRDSPGATSSVRFAPLTVSEMVGIAGHYSVGVAPGGTRALLEPMRRADATLAGA